jgi:hypothetical protein
MMAMSLLRSVVDDFDCVARALGFEGATLGRFLALSIFRCRLVGTRGNLLSNNDQRDSFYTVFSRNGAKTTEAA